MQNIFIYDKIKENRFLKRRRNIYKIIFNFFCCILFLVFICGCSSSKNDELLEPLFFENEEYSVYKTLKDSIYLNSNLFLETPEIKTKHSAITFFNNKNSAVLFYNIKEKNSLKMAFFSKKNSKWNYILDIPFGNMKLEKILTTKNNKDQSEFLIVGLKSRKEKIFHIYSIEHDDMKEIFSNSYNIMTLCDSNLDGNLNLVTLCDVPTELLKNKYNIKIEEDIEKKLKKQKEILNIEKNIKNTNKTNRNIFLVISLNKNGIKIEDCKEGIHSPIFNINKIVDENFNVKTLNTPCLFLCLEKSNLTGEKTKETFILDFNKNSSRVRIPFIHELKNENIAPVSFLNINKDKKLKFISTKPFPGYSMEKLKKISSQQQPFITIFSDISKIEKQNNDTNDEMFVNIKTDEEYKNTYINYKHKYGINLPERWNEKVTAKYKNDNQDIDFFIYNDSLKNNSQKLLTIKVCYNIDEKNENDLLTLKEKNKIFYKANIYRNSEIVDSNLKLTEQELKKIFFILE